MKKKQLLAVILTACIILFFMFISRQQIIEKYTCSDCNVILISLDTLRADHLGCYGYERNTSPGIDKFAESAILFENAYTQSPNTIMSHATMLTSFHPSVHRVLPDVPLAEEFKTLAEYFQEEGYKTAGFTTHATWLNTEKGFAQGFDYFHSEDTNAEKNNKLAFEWLENNSNHRFFLFLHYFDIHSDFDILPYETKTNFDKKFTIKYNVNFTGCEEDICASSFLINVNQNKIKISDEEMKYIEALYDGGIAYTDDQIQKLFDKLKDLGVYDKTIIIITADHGEEFMEHGRMLHDRVYMEVAHVPFILKHPKVAKQINITNPVGVIDIMPTLLDIAGIDYADIQGKSTMPIISGKEEQERNIFSFRYKKNDVLFLRNSNYTFFKDENEQHKLFDLTTDPYEKTNIINNTKQIAEKLLNTSNEFLAWNEKVKNDMKIRPKQADIKQEEKEKLKALGYVN